jgi:hypothetical protein
MVDIDYWSDRADFYRELAQAEAEDDPEMSKKYLELAAACDDVVSEIDARMAGG